MRWPGAGHPGGQDGTHSNAKWPLAAYKPAALSAAHLAWGAEQLIDKHMVFGGKDLLHLETSPSCSKRTCQYHGWHLLAADSVLETASIALTCILSLSYSSVAMRLVVLFGSCRFVDEETEA